mmetsp:Transcript_12209/g.47447  ORF Transcript_12209/g.47447 Transcript_12209/m.47447 type:complete len:208 (-) Transcript_12209:287-910(-)
MFLSSSHRSTARPSRLSTLSEPPTSVNAGKFSAVNAVFAPPAEYSSTRTFPSTLASFGSLTSFASLLSMSVRSPPTCSSFSAATVAPSCSSKYASPDTFFSSARLAFRTRSAPARCVTDRKSHTTPPGASHVTFDAVASFGNVALTSAAFVFRTSRPAAGPLVPANPVSSGNDSAVSAALVSMLIDPAVTRSSVLSVVRAGVADRCR